MNLIRNAIIRQNSPMASARANPIIQYRNLFCSRDGFRETPTIREPNTVPIPEPEPASPIEAAPAPILLAASTIILIIKFDPLRRGLRRTWRPGELNPQQRLPIPPESYPTEYSTLPPYKGVSRHHTYTKILKHHSLLLLTTTLKEWYLLHPTLRPGSLPTSLYTYLTSTPHTPT